MRSSTHQWKQSLQQLGRAFSFSHFHPACNAIPPNSVSWRKNLQQGPPYSYCKSGHFFFSNFRISLLNSENASIQPCSWNLNQRWFKGRSDTTTDQSTRSMRERAWDHDAQNALQKVARLVRDDEGEQHLRFKTLQRPKFQQDDIYIPVKACYISRNVDLKRLSEMPFLEVTPSRNSLIIRAADANPPGFAGIRGTQERYMVAFQYGSIVFFNFGDKEEEEALISVRKFCTDEFRETRKDDYGVLVRPSLGEWSEGGQDQLMLRTLDTHNIRVISSILGQSIALDHYAKKVDEMVNTFSELNRGMQETGTFTMTRKSLFQLVAAANSTMADVILRLGLLERSDAAWQDAKYAEMWEYLREEFELENRFENLDFKLNIIQHNVRFFLEILQNRKSDTREWIIIVLLASEIVVGVYQILLELKIF